MANVGTNKGRRLRVALMRFSAMLIEEARDLTGLPYPELDAQLGLPDGQSYRYSLYPIRKKSRAPQAGSIQELENRVASLLKRTAHKIVVENRVLFDGVHPGWQSDVVVGAPSECINVRNFESTDFQLGYADDWPTYRRLKYTLPRDGVRLLDLWAWQWGILWDQNRLPWPWTREAQQLPPDAPVESFLPAMVTEAKRQRCAAMDALAAAGNLPESARHP